MSKFMVIGNHLSRAIDYGTFDSQVDAIAAVNVARMGERGFDNQLVWELVSDLDNQFGFYNYIQAKDGTCTTRFFIVELNEPRPTLDEMVEQTFPSQTFTFGGLEYDCNCCLHSYKDGEPWTLEED